MKATRYAGIANALRDRIRKGDYPAGCALPSQKELASRFGTTVMTVRQALSVLQQEGLLRASHGVGTFVASGGEKGRDLRLRGLADSIRGARGRILTRIVAREYAVADPRVLAMLGPRARRCCCLTRVRLAGAEPVIFQRSYLPARLARVVQALTDADSLYERLNSVCGGVVQGREIVLPAALGKKEAAYLSEPAGAPALLSLRASFDLSSAVVLYDEAWIRGRRALLTIRQAGGLTVSSYSIPESEQQDPAAFLLSNSFWEDDQ